MNTPSILQKKLEEVPLIKTKNLTIEIQNIIYRLHFSKKTHHINKYIRKF